MKKSYYEILEVSSNASPEIIEKAYKTLSRKYHPDVQPKDKKREAEEKFKEIAKAYEVLSDEEQKAEYDEYQKLKQESSSKNVSEEVTEKDIAATKIASYTRKGVGAIATSIYNHTKKSKEDRNKDLTALAIALAFMVIMILLFWKVPFLRNFLFR